MAALTDRPTPAITSTSGPGQGQPQHAAGRERPRRRRRFLVPAATAVAGVALAAAVVVSLQSGPIPPATGAAKLVPGDALLYVHLSTDRTRPEVRQALALTRRLPGLPRLGGTFAGRIGIPLGAPWLGREAAFALLDTSGSSAGSLVVLDVRNRAGAEAFLARAGAVADGTYDRAALLRERSGTELAFARHYLLLGQPASVRAALDVAAGYVRSLAANPAYQRAAASEPADRVLDAYTSAGGLRRVLEPRAGLLGALGVLLDQPSLSGVAFSASPASGGVRVQIHQALYPALAQVGAAPRPFEPTLADVMPARSTLLLDMRGLAGSAPRVLAAAATLGIGGRIAPLLSRLGSALASEGVNVPQILSIFSGETAVALVPPRPGGRGGPALAIVTRTSHPQAAAGLLVGLAQPLAQLFPPPSSGAGLAPELADVEMAGVTIHQLALAPGLQLNFAVFRGLVVVSTNARAIAAIARHTASLGGSSGYRAALGNAPGSVGSLLYFDFNQLLSLGEQAGLMRSAQLTALRPDLERIRSVGLTTTRGESDTTAELFLQIP